MLYIMNKIVNYFKMREEIKVNQAFDKAIKSDKIEDYRRAVDLDFKFNKRWNY